MTKLFALWIFLLVSVKLSSGLPTPANLDYSKCDATEMFPVNLLGSALEKIEVFANISRLGVAIVRNNTQEMEALLSGICDPNDNQTLYSPSCCGWGGVPLTAGLSSLHIAVITGNLFALERLLEVENIAVDSQDENGETSLVHAVRFRIENQNLHYFMPIRHHLGFGGHLGPFGVDFFAPKVPKIPKVPVKEVPEVIESRLKMLNILVDGGANLDAVNKDGETALMQAVAIGQEEVVHFLVDNGADLDTVNKNGESPLMQAVSIGELKIVQILIDAGANLDTVNKYGETLLMQAVDNGQVNVVQILVDGGADLNAVNEDGEIALIQAVAIGDEEVAQFLINKGADSKGLDINVDYSGHGLDGYGWKQIFEVSKCCEECQLVAGCTHWTMVRKGGEGNGCWLKTEQGEKSVKIGAISGSKVNCLN